MITQAHLMELYTYDPEDGVFRHRRTLRRGIEGRVAGEVSHNGYRRVAVGGKKYRAHHLAWLWVYGELPPPGYQVDHINGLKLDNRIENLRLATPAQNQQNWRRATSRSTTGLLGVCVARDKFSAAIRIGGKTRVLGTFGTAEEAHQRYLEAKREHHAFATI